MNLFSFIKNQLSILDVIGEYTKLKKAGTYWRAVCPFHHEKTASFTVSPHKEIFYCFGCHAGGDLIAFIARAENCTQLEAAHHLVERYNLELPETTTFPSKKNTDEKNRYFILCEAVAQWCNSELKKSTTVLKYMDNRSINEKSITTFNIGYFPGGTQSIKSLVAHMRTKSILVDDLLQAKILSQGRTVLYSPFEDRIMFPIQDHLGRYCGFGGRIFKPNDVRAKYYNSHENDYFNKGSILFGFHHAKKSIQKTESIFLVEGYTDCIAMAQHGFLNTVATLGTACTSQHLKTLSRYVHHLIVLYDSDNAGKKAIMRLTELCWQVNIELKVIPLPDGQDPASFLQNNGDIQKAADQAQDIFTFFINRLADNFSENPLNKKLQLIQRLLDIVQKIEEPLKQDIILQKASKSLNIPIKSLQKELQKKNLKPKKMFLKDEPPTAETLTLDNDNSSRITLEKRILFAILNDISLFNKDNEDYLITCLPVPLSSILEKLKTIKEQSRSVSPGFPQLFQHLDEKERLFVNGPILQFEEKIEPQLFDHLLTRFQSKTWKIIVRDIKAKLTKAEQENNTQEVENILHNFSKLKKRLLNKNLEQK
ncbi:DNA primase [bacterium]|nr:DNA primase [bacterium]